MTKNTTLHRTIFITFCMLMSIGVSAQIPKVLNKGLAEGKVEHIYAFLNENVELTVLDYDDVCSNNQAKQVLENFFKKNKPTEYKVIHIGGEVPKFYVVGTMQVVGNQDYRVYFLMKEIESIPRIYQLRIEKQKP
ncbi:MAG: DUF4783 domain-containing protein [Bacteroidales bacterium]